MSSIQTAEILAVGSELLGLTRLETNSLFLTGRLNEIGIDVHVKSVVGDDAAVLRDVFRQALARADLVITSGGLGPTSDDLTREAIAEALGLPLDEDAEVLASIRARFERRRMPMPEPNRRQAAVPRGAVVLANSAGTAPGLWIEWRGKIVVLLPGPPRELEPMFDGGVVPRLQPLTDGRRVRRRVIRIASRPESLVEAIAQPVYGPLATASTPIETTILAAPGQTELHLSSRGTEIATLDAALDAAVAALSAAIGDAVVSVDGRLLEVVVGDALQHRGWRIAVAESCTAGLVAARLTEISGSSAWVAGGVIAYDNAIKRSALGVPDALLQAHGAVSEPVAQAMADGARTRFGVEVGLSVTGIAGPTGGTPEKPVGTVAIAIATPESAAVRTFLFVGDRQMIRTQSVVAALDMVRRHALPPVPRGRA